MSTNLEEHNNLPKNNSTDEVDLIVLFNYIGRGFSKIFHAIGRFFKFLFSLLVYALKAVLKYWMVILIVVVVATLIGEFYEKSRPEVYSSRMLVKPYFDSKYQLINNVDYYNALISNGNYDVLQQIFNIDSVTAKSLLSIKLDIAPESENDRMLEYETFISEVDSTRIKDFTYAQYLENRTIYSVNFFEIKVNSLKKDIFPSLEEGLNSSFKNEYSELEMKKRDALLEIERQNIIASISKVDSLQNVYIKVLEEESKSERRKGFSLGDGLSFEKDKSVTKEYELLNKNIELRDRLREIEEQKVEDDVLFDVVSGFQKIGNVDKGITDRFGLIFPIFAFLGLCLIYLAIKIIKFIKTYEG
ncbi:hypothetical protein [Formosa haliotis]|uniref:hypothetical protein n=1 Tax=Formosa haliotis TaxID=1555194 RepID=UPI0008263C4D|nr:hypothetical protein [Formosa haliotis]